MSTSLVFWFNFIIQSVLGQRHNRNHTGRDPALHLDPLNHHRTMCWHDPSPTFQKGFQLSCPPSRSPPCTGHGSSLKHLTLTLELNLHCEASPNCGVKRLDSANMMQSPWQDTGSSLRMGAGWGHTCSGSQAHHETLHGAPGICQQAGHLQDIKPKYTLVL